MHNMSHSSSWTEEYRWPNSYAEVMHKYLASIPHCTSCCVLSWTYTSELRTPGALRRGLNAVSAAGLRLAPFSIVGALTH